MQIKSGDSRTKTFFDSPASGFASSNDGFGKESAPGMFASTDTGSMIYDRGGFAMSLNLDSKLLNGSSVLSWTDQVCVSFHV